MSRVTEPLDFLVGHETDPEVRRRAEAYVAAMPDASLQGLFVALPVFDAMVRREELQRQRRATS